MKQTPRDISWLKNVQDFAFPAHPANHNGGTVKTEVSKSFHKTAHVHFQRVGNRLNGKQRGVFNPALDAAQKGAVKVRFAGEQFLGQRPAQPRLPHALSKLFRNVMAHSQESYPAFAATVCRLYPTAGLTPRYFGNTIRSDLKSIAARFQMVVPNASK